ncbi:unnamed protein product, partial [Echinostoma caproni]|uniref:SKA2 domain-containing protein n=1 Tax=Echinostoma caproni TaxID=27848 RepID=A0A183B619_9TREM
MYSELAESSDEDTLPMREIPILHEVAETSDWARTQIALEAALVTLDLQNSIIHKLREKVYTLDNDLSHLTALFKDNFPACAAAGQAIALSKQQIFETAAKLESAAKSKKTKVDHFVITVSEVEEQLKRVNSYSSMGPDEIQSRILKESADVLAAKYAHLFQ